MKEQIMREAGAKLRSIFDHVTSRLKPGESLNRIDSEVGSLLKKEGARSCNTFLGLRGNMSFAVNYQVVQGLDYGVLQPGDLVSADMTLYYKGFFVDKAVSVVLDPKHYVKAYLADGVNYCLQTGIKNARGGMTVGQLGGFIEAQASLLNLVVCTELGGHTIGESHHMNPLIPNFNNYSEELIKPGSFIAIEPIVFYGLYVLEYMGDELRADVLSAHAEDTVLITETGAEVIT